MDLFKFVELSRVSFVLYTGLIEFQPHMEM